MEVAQRHSGVLFFWLVLTLTTKFALTDDDGGIVERCVDDEIAFGCKEDDTDVVIKEAWHYGAWHRRSSECKVSTSHVQFKKNSLLQYMNKQCASKRLCIFDVWEKVPESKQYEQKWKNGIVRLDYECVPKASIQRKCDQTLTNQTGWISNIGYPQYYLGPGACTFTIQVDFGQKISLSIVDLSLRDIVRPIETTCKDRLTVNDKKAQLLSACGDLHRPIQLTTEENELKVTLHASTDVFTKRGFLLQYKAIGCQTPAIPSNGSLLFRNRTHAEVECDTRHIFADTMTKVKVLRCLRRSVWDQVLPNCTDLNELLATGRITEGEYWYYNGTAVVSFLYLKKEVVYDIIVPSLLIAFAVLANFAVLLIIGFFRRSIKDDFGSLESLPVIPEKKQPLSPTQTPSNGTEVVKNV